MAFDTSLQVTELVRSALDVATLRSQVLASNIANRDSIGHVRMKIAFDAAMGQADSASLRMDAPQGGRLSPATLVPDTSSASLEEDLLALSKNTLNYQALTRALSRHLSISSLIANGGRS